MSAPSPGRSARQTKAPPDANADLKSLPLPEVETRLDSSPAGLSQAAARKRLNDRIKLLAYRVLDAAAARPQPAPPSALPAAERLATT